MDRDNTVTVDGLPHILADDQDEELRTLLQDVEVDDLQESMLSKYIIARVYVHDKA